MKLSNRYLELGDKFYQESTPDQVPSPQLILWNQNLADHLRIDINPETDEDLLGRWFSGCERINGSHPIALAYAGHQYAQLVPQLGDGRAHLLGEVIADDGSVQELQLKGSGATPFSRGGDGKCGLGPALREYIMSEAMVALGVPAMPTLSVVTTGQAVYRQQPQAGAVVCRVTSSHLRIGSFVYFAIRHDFEAVEQLIDLAIERDYQHLSGLEDKEKVLGFYQAVIDKTIALIVHWMRVGFIHGVMNTDNLAINGQTIDFGPCAMLGEYDPKSVYSSIDRRGRYAFGNQASIAQWNLARLGECLLPLVDQDTDTAVEIVTDLINQFPQQYQVAFNQMMAHKLGFEHVSEDGVAIASRLLDIMQSHQLDYSNTFVYLERELLSNSELGSSLDFTEFDACEDLQEWVLQWRSLLGKSDKEISIMLMKQNNPKVIPRNYLVEEAIQQANESGELHATYELLQALKQPYQMTDRADKFYQNYHAYDQDYKTFCGT